MEDRRIDRPWSQTVTDPSTILWKSDSKVLLVGVRHQIDIINQFVYIARFAQ